MNKDNKKIYLFFSVISILEILFFKDYISPIQWGQLKVNGQSCTCPDEKVVNSSLYLRFITPDSLKQYHIDYSEIYVTEKPTHYHDPMGDGTYIIIGEVIGKERVSKADPWNLVVNVKSWRPVAIGYNFLAKLLLLLTIIGLPISLRIFNKSGNKPS